MALQKQTVEIGFSKGLDTKTDPFRLSIGNFVGLTNSIFDTLGRLTKRNGFGSITSLPSPASYLTTFNGNLTTIGQTLQAFSPGSNTWVDSGLVQPLQMSTLPLIRNSVNQTQCDTAFSTNDLICTVYTETTGSTITYKYAVAVASTGQNVIAPTAIPSDATYGTPRVFYLGTYFIILFTNKPSLYNLKYLAINTITLGIGSPVILSTSVTPATTVNFDGAIYNNSLYIGWNGVTGSGIHVTSLSSTLVQTSVVIPDAAHAATVLSLNVDSTDGIVWVSYYDSATSNGYTFALLAQTLATILSAHQVITSQAVLNITSSAQNGLNTIFYEVSNKYAYDTALASNYVESVSCTQSGTVSSAFIVLRSVGLGSKSFLINGTLYFLASYSSPYQPTYFVVNGSLSTQASPIIIAKLAYSNGGGYLTTGLPSVYVNGLSASVGYLYKDLIASVNKNTAVPAGNQIAGVYSQTGINLATFDLTSTNLSTVEIGNNLHITGGFLWMYDGYQPVEHNFFLWPDSIEATWFTTGGAVVAQPDAMTNTNAYYYQITYEWTDNQGNIHRSAPSIPVSVTTTGTGTTGSINLNIPTLRLTYKKNVKIVIYRWSVAQETYYQVTSISVPTLNDTTSDYIQYTDTQPDALIIGNSIIYTNGGVIEDVNAPSPNAMTLFDDRLWMIDAEDPNLLWYSKQVIESTPVEMSDLFTYYAAPTTAAVGSTGPCRCLYPMDDKLILTKDNALYYINGTGPDNTGANGQYSPSPVYITSIVGSNNPSSFVMTPAGIMFQSVGKGIWLLGRDLSTKYIGAEVEAFNGAGVLSAVNIPETNQVRFNLDSGVVLMFDHFVGQWATFEGIPGISSTVYQNLHTYMSAPITVTPPHGSPYVIASQVFQETPGSYLDGSSPVLMSFVTGWINMAGLQGYKRFYYMFLLGTYISPHKLSIGFAYDFNPSVVQLAGVSPDNYTPPWGGDATWGDSDPYGGPGDVEDWQINIQRQTCQSFQISLNEYYDSTLGAAAGAGLTISSLELVVGLKKNFPRNISASHRTG